MHLLETGHFHRDSTVRDPAGKRALTCSPHGTLTVMPLAGLKEAGLGLRRWREVLSRKHRQMEVCP